MIAVSLVVGCWLLVVGFGLEVDLASFPLFGDLVEHTGYWAQQRGFVLE